MTDSGGRSGQDRRVHAPCTAVPQQPNGWAPLRWIAVESLAGEIRQRWLRTVQAMYGRAHRLVEKYALRAHPEAQGGSGGEYPLHDGFGWTNGVTRQWL